LSRAFWAALVLLHVPGILSTAHAFASQTGDLIALLRCAAMSTATVFFVLKIADWPALRFQSGWRSPVSLVLIVLLMHVGVIDRALGQQWDFGNHSATAACFLVAVLPQTLAMAVRLFERLVVWFSSERVRLAALVRETEWQSRQVPVSIPAGQFRPVVRSPRSPPRFA
jgi:hypothetical protein